MTPAMRAAKAAGITIKAHEYSHDPANTNYGLEAAQALNLDPVRVFKTLLVALNGDQRQLAVGIVPVTGQLDLKAMASACKVKKVEMAEPKNAERATGYIVGGISPLGQKKRLPTVLDESALSYESIYVSGGKRGLDIEIAPNDLLKVCGAHTAAIGRAA
ncbi:Cys-tRNA(Pro) deacylase [Thiosocius teredinicola]|uniref:Cys-tRNA(Pro) deacylase n=1 Tax=Thiosocius teredinicola TaxID=1973002 RepID=UPI000990CBFD